MEDNMFWLDWMEADELVRLKMLKTLPIKYTPEFSLSMFNSYLTDLFEAVKQYGFQE